MIDTEHSTTSGSNEVISAMYTIKDKTFAFTIKFSIISEKIKSFTEF